MNPHKFDASTLTPEAFRFSAPAELFSEDGEASAKRRRVRGVAYSGDVVTDHGYWSRVAFDLSTTSVDAKIPMLVDHDRGRRAGFAALTLTDRVEVAEAFLLDNAVGKEVAADSDAGFPWQFSVHIAPDRIEFVDAGQSVTVNGRVMDGPLHVFRGNRIRELSLTPVGADHRTTATIFSATPAPVEPAPAPAPPTIEEPATMISPEQFAALEARVAALSTDLEARTAERDAATAERDTMRAQLEAQAQAARFSAVVTLFREVGRPEPKDVTAAGAYMGLSEEQFAAVSTDMRATRPTLPAALFGHTAIDGAPGATSGEVNDPVQFAARIRAHIETARAAGRSVNEAEAAAAIRAAAPAA